MRAFVACLVLTCAAGLAAQAKPVDMAVAYPATALVYAEANLGALGDYATFQQVLRGLVGESNFMDPATMAARKLELALTKPELEALSQGAQRVSGALIDITLRGPKLQFVVEHNDLSALDRAMREAAKLEFPAFEGSEEYEGTVIYRLRLRFPREAEAGMMGEINPLSGMFDELEFGAAVYKRWLVLAPNVSAAKDAIDGLSFPEDPLETLLANKRYTEAFKDYKDPGAQLFVNIEAVINTVERIAGDRPDEDMLGWWLRSILPGVPADAGLAGSLTQYNQLKGFSAAMWMPQAGNDASAQARVEARLSFHNTPGWLDALRADPQPTPLLDVIPIDTIFALTANVDNAEKLYNQVKEFVISRAREAGQPEAVKSFELLGANVEKELSGVWQHTRGGVAMVMVPDSTDPAMAFWGRMGGLGMFEVHDWRAAEDALYEGLLRTQLLKGVRGAEGDLSPVEMLHGIEIHGSSDGQTAYAFLPGEGKKGVFLFGQTKAIHHVVAQRAKGNTLGKNPAFGVARATVWEKHNVGMYVNGGMAMEFISSIFDTFSSLNMWNWDDDEQETPDRDDAEKQRNPVPRLAQFFSGAAIVGAQRSGDALIEFRFAAAGIPGPAEFSKLSEHYRDVARNFEARDDLIRVRDAATTSFALRGEPPATVEALVESGNLVKPEWAIDPFGAGKDTPSTRTYAIAPAPKDVDIRQAILLAHQREPGLDGKHLAVLWNNHVVALTPEQLKSALERAAKGEPLDEAMYSVLLKPLHEREPSRPPFISETPAKRVVEVVVIDDEGDEETIEVEPKDASGQVEKALNEAANAGKETAPKEETPKEEPVPEPKPEPAEEEAPKKEREFR